jgi:transcriptional regulatory protein RtcR
VHDIDQIGLRSRTKKNSQNDADRLRKYLARFGLEWSQLSELVSS